MPDKRKGKKKKGKKGGKDWLAPVTSRKKAKKYAKASAKLEFRPTERQIEGELRASQMRQREIPSWFSGGQDSYLGKLAALQRGASDVYSAARADMDARQQRALGQDEDVRSRIDAEERADAERRGVQYTGSPGATLAQASLARRDMADYGQSFATLQGANQNAYFADKQRIGRGEQISQILKEQGRQRGLFADQRELAERKGAFLTDEMRNLRESEREYGLAEREFGEGKKSRRTQKKLAKTYGTNKKKEQKRSLSNQLTVANAQARNKKAEQRRSKKSQLKVGRAQGKRSRADDRRTRRRDARVGLNKKGKKKKKGRGGKYGGTGGLTTGGKR